MRRTYIFLSLIAFVAFVTFVGYALARLIPWCAVGTGTCRLGVTEWAYWVAAIGSVGAWIGTIWIATSERRERVDRELSLALFVSGGVVLKLIEISNMAKDVGAFLAGETPFSAANLVFWADRLKKIPSFEHTELAALTILPNHVATKLLALNGDVNWCKRAIWEWSESNADGYSDDEIEHFKIIGERLIAAAKRMKAHQKNVTTFMDKHDCHII